MAVGRFVAYYRVSTAGQERSGLGLEGQQAAVRAYLNGGAWDLIAEFTETESGKVNDRPKLAEALNLCRMTGATLVIAKLDRLSRDAHFLIGLERAGVAFVAADMPNANRLTVGIMALVAEQEREAISARTKAALAAAKARGVKLGGVRESQRGDAGVPDPSKARKEVTRKADAFAARVRPLVEEMQTQGMGLRGVARALAGRGIMTARGGQWTPTAVKNLLMR